MLRDINKLNREILIYKDIILGFPYRLVVFFHCICMYTCIAKGLKCVYLQMSLFVYRSVFWLHISGSHIFSGEICLSVIKSSHV